VGVWGVAPQDKGRNQSDGKVAPNGTTEHASPRVSDGT
jgi:hypothetical protein